jgi:hypothetical protein
MTTTLISDIHLAKASEKEIGETVCVLLHPSATVDEITVQDSSGESGKRTVIVKLCDKPVAVVRVEAKVTIYNAHPNSRRRIREGSAALRKHGVALPLLAEGPDWYAEAPMGIPSMKASVLYCCMLCIVCK